MPANSLRAWSLMGNAQRLDGGAMFGNAPRALWQRWLPPDEHNRISLACRCLLLDDGKRKILLETGIGAFLSPKLRTRYGVDQSEHCLLGHLASLGLSDRDIDVVVLSHLHFDHAGGLLSSYQENEEPRLLFPKARFVVGREAWERSCSPHPRDRASFIPELAPLLENSGRLEIVEQQTSSVLGSHYRFHFSHGHTPGLMLTEFATAKGPILFASDLIPGVPWVHLPITMGYDRFPELLIDEKRTLLKDLHGRNGHLFFTHDPSVALARVACDAKGRYLTQAPQTALDGSDLLS